MKRVLNVVFILILTIFVSGYKYDIEVEVKDNKNVNMKETMEFSKTDLNTLICSNSEECELTEDLVKQSIKSFYYNKNKNTGLVDNDFNITFDQATSTANYSSIYKFNDIDDMVGSINETFNLYNMDFAHKLFTVNGKKYSFNTKYKSDINADATLKLILPVEGENSNADEKSADNKTFKWNLRDNMDFDIKFELAVPVDTSIDDDYKKVHLSKYVFIGLAALVALIAILSFVNIIKNEKKNEAKRIKEQSEESAKFAVNDVFNANANNSVPISMTNEFLQNPADLEKPENHQDVISNKFLDESFAGPTIEEPPKTMESEAVQPAPTPEVQPSEPVISNENIASVEPTNNSNQSDMSSVAFGGAPVGDKNINEIK